MTHNDSAIRTGRQGQLPTRDDGNICSACDAWLEKWCDCSGGVAVGGTARALEDQHAARCTTKMETLAGGSMEGDSSRTSALRRPGAQPCLCTDEAAGRRGWRRWKASCSNNERRLRRPRNVEYPSRSYLQSLEGGAGPKKLERRAISGGRDLLSTT